MATPFKWVKQVASHFGGTAQGMAISWPDRIKDQGGIRHQFHHVIDIVPTILEATGIPMPASIDGITQRPMDGVSLAYSWDKANASAPTRHTTQYFETLGNRAIYHDGWVAATTPATLPWQLSTKPAPDVITGYQWELYHVAEDPTQFNDLAARMPDKLKQMQALFYAEAKRHDVLPLDNSTLARWNTPRPNLTAGRKVFSYSGELAGVPRSGAPSILGKSYRITAEVTIPEGGAEGTIVAEGGRFGGYALILTPPFNWWSRPDVFRNLGVGFLAFGLLLIWRGQIKHWSRLKMRLSHAAAILASLLLVAVGTTRVVGIGRGKPVFVYNLLDVKRTVWAGPALGPGKHTIVFDFTSDGPELGKGGTGSLSVDGKEVARNSMENSTPITFPEDESFDIGRDTRTGVAMIEYRYDSPFPFTGTIDKLTFALNPEPQRAALR
jgi:arylsulfatase